MKRPDPEAVRARKQALQARQAELREHLNQKRATLADRRKAAPNRPPEQRSRCWPLCAVLAALLLACLLKDCRCDPEVVEPPAPVAIARPEPTSTEPVEDPVPPPPVRRRGRPSAPPVAAGPLPWLEAFQLQVFLRIDKALQVRSEHLEMASEGVFDLVITDEGSPDQVLERLVRGFAAL